MPLHDDDYSGRWRAIKIHFSKAIEPVEPRTAVMHRRDERGVWQRRFWEHTIRDEDDYAAHVDYVHFNPVRHGLAASPAQWQHSTFHRSLDLGLYPADWAGPADEADYARAHPPYE